MFSSPINKNKQSDDGLVLNKQSSSDENINNEFH